MGWSFLQLVLASQDCCLYLYKVKPKNHTTSEDFSQKAHVENLRDRMSLQVTKVFIQKNGKSLTASLVIGELLNEISFPIHAKRG